MCIVGGGFAYEEQMARLALEAGAIGALGKGPIFFWLGDAIGRFVLGVSAYFL